MFLFFTQLIGRMVMDRHGHMVGRVHDLTTQFDGIYPPITGLILTTGVLRRHYAVVPWEHVQSNRYNGRVAFQLKDAADELTWSFDAPPATESTIARTILDEQIVDVYNRKVVRVNDVHLLEVESAYRIAHVDVGMRGIVRRLGWQPVVDRAVRLLRPHAVYLTRESLIAWKYVQQLTVHPVKGTIPLALAESELRDIPPADLGEMLVELDPYQRVALFKALEIPVQSQILGELDARFRRELLAELDLQSAVAVLERMPPDEATDTLQDMPRAEVTRLMGAVSVRTAQTLAALLPHHEDSAGGLMTPHCVRVPETATVGEAIALIKAQNEAATFYYVYVVDPQGRLVGVVSFRELLFTTNEVPIRDCMEERPVTVGVHDSAKSVAFTMDKYNFLAIPVVGDDDTLLGIITVDDTLAYAVATAWGDKSGMM